MKTPQFERAYEEVSARVDAEVRPQAAREALRELAEDGITPRTGDEWRESFEASYEDVYGELWFSHFPDAFISAPGNRLTAAFQELRTRGYFAEQYFADCGSCGFAAIPEDQQEAAVFYHAQAFDYLMESGEVYLNWSGDGEEITSVLKGHGLTVEWDGDSDTTILVKDLFEPRPEPSQVTEPEQPTDPESRALALDIPAAVPSMHGPYKLTLDAPPKFADL